MTPTEQRLTLELRYLQLPKRAQVACEHLRLITVADGLACGEAEFTAAPNCGKKTFAAFRARLDGLEQITLPDGFTQMPLGRTLIEVSEDPIVGALAKAGFITIGHLVTTPDAELHAVFGVEVDALAKLRATLVKPTLDRSTVLPRVLLDIELNALLLPDFVVELVEREGLRTVGALIEAEHRAPGLLGADQVKAVQDELARVIRSGLDAVDSDARDSLFGAVLATLSGSLQPSHREVLHLRIGIDQPAKEPWQIAAESRRSESDVIADVATIRETLRSRCSRILDRFARTTAHELEANLGILTPSRTTPGGMLDSGRCAGTRRDAPLRLANVLFPDTFYFHGTFLSKSTPEEHSVTVRVLREMTAREHLPRPLVDVQARLGDLGLDNRHEVVVYTLRTTLQRSIEIDAERGELIHMRVSTISDRLHQLLEERDEPTPIDTLSFDYRERHRRCKRLALLDSLRADFRFLEIGPDVWSLRNRHLDELDLTLQEAKRVSGVICSAGGRHSIADLAEGEDYTERQTYLLVDALRHDPTVRDLGRHEFCPRHQEHSAVMRRILADLRRAMGEIPISRFLANQPESERRVVDQLLRKNRYFVCPTPDRVDMLTNYPFDSDRLRRLLVVADQCLDQHGGYSTLYQINKAVTTAQLGGSFLTEHLLGDLLRRHGHYEFLPGDVVAHASLGLTGWIQQQAREALRQAGVPRNADQLVAEHPELAEFGHCLHELLHRDPLVVTPDGESFRLA